MSVHRTSPLRRTQPEVQAYLTRLLLAGEQLTAAQAARRLACGETHTRAALVALHDAGLVFIAKRERFIVGGPLAAVYAWCGFEARADVAYPRQFREVSHG